MTGSSLWKRISLLTYWFVWTFIEQKEPLRCQAKEWKKNRQSQTNSYLLRAGSFVESNPHVPLNVRKHADGARREKSFVTELSLDILNKSLPPDPSIDVAIQNWQMREAPQQNVFSLVLSHAMDRSTEAIWKRKESLTELFNDHRRHWRAHHDRLGSQSASELCRQRCKNGKSQARS